MTAAFVAIGDIHLDPFIWKRHRHITGDAVVGFSSSVDHAINLGVPFVMVGDIFDTVDPPPAMIKQFRTQIDRLATAGLRCYGIQGNHDKRPTPWYQAVHDWPIHIGDGVPVEIGGLRCRGFDYATRDSIQESLVNLSDPTDCLFIHQAVRQYLGFEGAWNTDLAWVPEVVRMVVMGDIHACWETEIRPGVTAYYTGSTHPRDISQVGPKSVLVVNRDLTVRRAVIPSRPITRIRAEATDQLDLALQWVTAADRTVLPPVCFLSVTPDLQRDRRYLDLVKIEDAIVIVDHIQDGVATVETPIDQLVSPEEGLRRMLSLPADQEVFDLCSALLGPGSALETANTYKENYARSRNSRTN